jgi:hypothetical protein
VTNVTSGQTDPFGGSTAGSLTCNNAGGGAFSVSAGQVGGVGALTANTHYEVSGYLKSVVSPVWMRITINDPSNSFDGWVFFVNCSTAAVVGTLGGGGGVLGATLDCFSAQLVAHGFVQWTFAGHYTSNSSVNTQVSFQFADTSSTANPTINQQFYYYQLGA